MSALDAEAFDELGGAISDNDDNAGSDMHVGISLEDVSRLPIA